MAINGNQWQSMLITCGAKRPSTCLKLRGETVEAAPPHLHEAPAHCQLEHLMREAIMGHQWQSVSARPT